MGDVVDFMGGQGQCFVGIEEFLEVVVDVDDFLVVLQC